MPTVAFYVHGVPQPQGSMRAFVRGGKPVITSSNKNLGDWRRLIADQAQPHARMHDGPICVRLAFRMPKPKSAPKTKLWCDKRPDLDKLVRSALDSLTGIMWKDDAQVVEIVASKLYAEQTGVDITIFEMPASDL